MHVIFHLIFAVSLLKWLTLEFKKPFTPLKHIWWLTAGVGLGIIATSLAYVDGGRLGNLLLHGIGGGMVTACSYEYVKRNLGWEFNWRLDLGALFLLVSAFGVLNEIFEFAGEILGYGPFSLDSQDTWRDFVANTTGAILVWLFVRVFMRRAGSRG